ncbi:MAG TPA: hypothetical protein VLH77_03285, partial [Gammaproteobacteria bacterium]|nr:hypothetical protein [Gammaproteobacteria bacterium]
MSIHSDPLYVNVKEAFGLKAGAVEAPRDKKSLTVVTTTSMKRPENAYDSIDFDIDFSIFTTSQKGQADQEKPIISGSGTIAPKKSPFWSVQVWKHNNVFTNAVEGEQKGRVGTAVIKFFHVLGALIGDAVRVVLFPISIPAYFKGPNVNVAPTYPWNKKQVSEINTSTTSTNTAGTKVDMPKPETASASSTSSKPASSEPSITVEKEASKASEAAEVRFALAGFGDYLQGGKLKDRLQKDFQAYSKTTDLHANHVEYRNAKLETSPLADLQRHSRNEGKKLATFALISSELPEGTTNILLAVQNVKQVLGQVLGDIRYNTPDQPLVTDAKVAREEAFKIILNSANAVNTPLSLSFMNGVYAEFERDVNNKAGFVDAIQAAHQKIEAAARLGIVADAPSAIKAIDAKIGSNRIIPAIVKELVADLARGVTAAQAIRNAFAKIE